MKFELSNYLNIQLAEMAGITAAEQADKLEQLQERLALYEGRTLKVRLKGAPHDMASLPVQVMPGGTLMRFTVSGKLTTIPVQLVTVEQFKIGYEPARLELKPLSLPGHTWHLEYPLDLLIGRYLRIADRTGLCELVVNHSDGHTRLVFSDSTDPLVSIPSPSPSHLDAAASASPLFANQLASQGAG